MRAEREKQDFMWHTASAEKQKQTQIQPSNSPHIQK